MGVRTDPIDEEPARVQWVRGAPNTKTDAKPMPPMAAGSHRRQPQHTAVYCKISRIRRIAPTFGPNVLPFRPEPLLIQGKKYDRFRPMWILIEHPLECGGRRKDDTIAFAQYPPKKKHTITIHEEDGLPGWICQARGRQFVRGGVRERIQSEGSVSSELYFPRIFGGNTPAHKYSLSGGLRRQPTPSFCQSLAENHSAIPHSRNNPTIGHTCIIKRITRGTCL